jgi:hypothetical protein
MQGVYFFPHTLHMVCVGYVSEVYNLCKLYKMEHPALTQVRDAPASRRGDGE